MTQHGRHGVVVGVDESPEALEAARFATGEASARGAALTLAHAAELLPLDVPYTGEYLQGRRERGRQILEEVQTQLPHAAGLRVRLVLEVDSAVALLCRLSTDAELLVVGHRHCGRLEKIFAGDVSGPVAAHADCPVVVVPRGWTARSSGGQPVVLALDGESPARSALDVAFTSAERLRVELVVLHASEPSLLQRVVEEDRVNISTITAGARQDHPDVIVRELRLEAEPDRGLLAAAGAATLLVVGRRRGRSPLDPWTQSTSRRLLEQMHCPVAVVPEDSVPTRPGASRSNLDDLAR